jgi:hypothetical protein
MAQKKTHPPPKSLNREMNYRKRLKQQWFISKHYAVVWLEGLRKTTKYFISGVLSSFTPSTFPHNDRDNNHCIVTFAHHLNTVARRKMGYGSLT